MLSFMPWPVFGRALGRAFGRGGGGVIASTFLEDNYTDTHAAGAVNGTLATDGVNIRSVNDSANKMPITVNGLGIQANTGTADPAIRYPAQTLVCGLVVAQRAKYVSGSANQVYGADSDASGQIADGVQFFGGGQLYVVPGGGLNIVPRSYVAGTIYDLLTVKLNPGALFYIRKGVYADWTLLFPSVQSLSSLVYPALGSGSSGLGTGACSAIISKIKGGFLSTLSSQLSAAFQYKSVSVNNDTLDNFSGNGIIEHTIVAATGVTQELMVRRVDDNNCVIIRMNQVAGTILVIEKVAGVETPLVGGTATQTWTNGTSYRIVVNLTSTQIAVTVGATDKNFVSSTYNLTQTGVKVSHAGTNLIAWPTNPLGAIKIQMDAFFP